MNAQPPDRAVRATAWTVGVFYLLIAFEFFYMATPFALYFYGAYVPGLEYLNGIPVLAWLTRFFLPHFVSTSSWLVNSAAAAGGVLTALGTLGFLVGAAQVYSRKLLKRGPAIGGVYRIVQHPQYAALILAGAGMLFIWPRLLMVVFFVTMLFVYEALASIEEHECLRRYGQAYVDYQKRTPRFLPFRVPFRIPLAVRAAARTRLTRFASGILTYAIVLAAALGVAFALQTFTLRHLFALEVDATLYVALIPLDPTTLARVAQAAETDPRVRTRLAVAESEGSRLLAYVMPWEWSIPEIPMNGVREHHTPDESDHRRLKVAYTRAVFSGNARARGLDILRRAIRTEPVAEAWIDQGWQVARVLGPPERTFYGTVPVPTF